MKFVHTNVRNILGNEKAGKISHYFQICKLVKLVKYGDVFNEVRRVKYNA